MLARLTISALLKSVVLTTACAVIVIFSLRAWDSWQRLQLTNRVDMIAEASSHVFRAMHNLRSDRASTNRTLIGDAKLDPEIERYLRAIRDAELPALRSAVEILITVEFADQTTLVPELARLTETLSRLQFESWDAMSKPMTSRRPGLAGEYMENTAALLDVLDKLSNHLAAAVNHSDPVIDQLLTIKQVSWLLRNTAGEASVLVANGLGAGRLPPDIKHTYSKLVGGIEAMWTALEAAAAGAPLPASLAEAMAAAKSAYFDPQYLALRDRLLNVLLSGEKPEMTANQWSPFTVGRMASAVVVAERALEAAREHTSAQHSLALRSLLIQLTLLVAVIVLSCAVMSAIRRRVITPLHTLRDAMLQVASGDLAVDTGYARRQDEIGALAGALEIFKRQAADKLRIEAQEQARNIGAARRQKAIEAQIIEFESGVRQTLQALGQASSQMRTTSCSLSAISDQTNTRVEGAQQASGEASHSVETVAAASQQLSASINDISRQAGHAADIASHAVNQARDTDGAVQVLAQTAGRIGEVVDLINSIAAQTNLLALNATIEAARAGDAGRGFAVVASEVKSLASQTAKATDDISEQIAGIQRVAGEAVDAIKGIGGIITEVNEVAAKIAAAVREQGVATEEISRSTRHAAQGTRNVAANITGVKNDADAAAAAADDVKQASDTLETQSQLLGDQIHQFLGNIRAAS